MSPLGLCVTMPTPCPRCRSTIATIGAGKDPHAASLICACDRWLGWMPAARFNFLSEVLRHFGRPTEPIEMGPLPDGGGVEAVRYHATLTEPQGGAMLMPKASDFFPSNYMRAADLAGKDRIVTIDRVETALFENDGKKQPKPVIYFKEAGVKPLVANKTNFVMIASIHGDETDGWSGKRIVVYRDMVAFKGQVQEAIRVKRVPEPVALPTQTAA